MTTLADFYLAKLGLFNIKTYPQMPMTIFLSQDQLEVWTQLDQLDKSIAINNPTTTQAFTTNTLTVRNPYVSTGPLTTPSIHAPININTKMSASKKEIPITQMNPNIASATAATMAALGIASSVKPFITSTPSITPTNSTNI